MSSRKLSDEIRELVQSITEQQKFLEKDAQDIPQIEFDLIKTNIRKLYDSVIQLEKLAATKPEFNQPAPPIHSTDELIAQVEMPSKEEETTVTDENLVHETAQPVPAHIQPEAITASAKQPQATDAPVSEPEEIIQKATISGKRIKEFTRSATGSLFDDHPTVGEKYPVSKTLHDKIATASEDKSLATRLQKNPVTDLKKSIGINEKFSFINELFDGDLNAYNEAIDMLNQSSSRENALSALDSGLSEKYGWDPENESIIKLRGLVERRFGA